MLTARDDRSGRLLTAAREVLVAKETEDTCRAIATSSAKLPHVILASAIDQCGVSARLLSTLQATTREGLILKARAALAAIDALRLTAREQVQILQSLVLDLIELVPTLIDERGRSIVPPAPRAGEGA